MMGGCSASNPPPAPVSFGPVVIDLAPTRCAPPDRRIAAEWGKVTPRPTPRACEPEGVVGICAGDAASYAQALEQSEARKNQMGRILERDYGACRGGEQAKPTS